MKPEPTELSCTVSNNNCHLQASDQLKESFWKHSVAGQASLGFNRNYFISNVCNLDSEFSGELSTFLPGCIERIRFEFPI